MHLNNIKTATTTIIITKLQQEIYGYDNVKTPLCFSTIRRSNMGELNKDTHLFPAFLLGKDPLVPVLWKAGKGGGGLVLSGRSC
jgi:hypothetical protein